MKKEDYYKSFLLYIYKVSETTYYQRNRETILNRAKDYYIDNKEALRKRAKNNYKELSEKDKNIKRNYGRNRYHNMSEEKTQKLKQHQKKLLGS